MRRGRIEIIIKLLDVLAMVSLVASDTEQTLFEDRILLVPQGEPETEPLVIVGYSCNAILAPSICPGTSVFVRKVAPSIAIA
jgi:hypothetical protein